jgi:hypothetical protein
VPQGYYTVEQWMSRRRSSPPEWIALFHLPLGKSLTAAENAIRKLAKPGFYRVVQTQRVIWAENEQGTFRMRKSHAGSPESLNAMREMFDRCAGRYPAEEVKAARRRAKSAKSSKEV